MLVLGLLLILIATAVFVGALYDGGEDATVEVLGQSLDTSVGGVFVTGAATMLVFLVGVLLLQASMGRARRKRAERKQVKQQQRESVSRLEQERAQLKAENERLSKALSSDKERSRAGSAPAAGAVPADRGTSSTKAHDHSHDHPTDHSHDDEKSRPGLRDRLGLGSDSSTSSGTTSSESTRPDRT